MSARFVSSKLISSIRHGKKTVTVEFVDQTTAWTRPSAYPAHHVRDDFLKVAAKNMSNFKESVVKVAMKESLHESKSDQITHFTAYGIDAEGNVVDVQHLYKDQEDLGKD